MPSTDLNPLLQKAGIDKNKVFVKTMIDYTQYKGKQCTLPLLGDAMGLYYNKAMFAAAGITSPPQDLVGVHGGRREADQAQG